IAGDTGRQCDAEAALIDAAVDAGLPEEEATRTARSGLSAGISDALSAGEANGRRLEHMSDVALAQTVWRELTQEFGEIIQAEGNIYAYRETHWVPLAADELRRRIHRLDGARLPNGRRIALSRARIDGVINELHTMVAQGEFFVQQHTGINCSNGFVAIARNGSAALEAHSRSHR